MPVFMARIGENLEEYFQMHAYDLPKSIALFQHINIVSTYDSFLRDVKEPFATEILKDITHIKICQ